MMQAIAAIMSGASNLGNIASLIGAIKPIVVGETHYEHNWGGSRITINHVFDVPESNGQPGVIVRMEQEHGGSVHFGLLAEQAYILGHDLLAGFGLAPAIGGHAGGMQETTDDDQEGDEES